MTKYKCETHKLSFACLSCVRAWIARHDALLAIVNEVAQHEISDSTIRARQEAGYKGYELIVKARELLNEVEGEKCE